MYTVHNNVEDKIIFHGSEIQFIYFMKKILKENEDHEDFSILGISDATDYLENYCANLDMVANPLKDFKEALKNLLEEYNATLGCQIEGDTHGLINTMIVEIGKVEYELTGGEWLDWNDLK
jgi:hypothetical protein